MVCSNFSVCLGRVEGLDYGFRKMITILSTKENHTCLKERLGSMSKCINKEIQPFEASILKIFGKAVYKVSEVKGRSRLAALCRSNLYKDMNYFLSLFVL